LTSSELEVVADMRPSSRRMETEAMSDLIELTLIYGSTREGRFCDVVARWAAAEIDRHADFALQIIDPATMQLPSRHQRTRSDGLRALDEVLARADAFVVVTPEYNHGYPAALKFLIDCFKAPWRAKPVAFVSYGGISGGLRAVEQLRLVFAELHAVAIRDSVSFANARSRFDADGRLLDPELPQEAMATMLRQLSWWALALRDAREARPYGETAA
jgi:NAD(P)H-dependent FMN reductase